MVCDGVELHGSDRDEKPLQQPLGDRASKHIHCGAPILLENRSDNRAGSGLLCRRLSQVRFPWVCQRYKSDVDAACEQILAQARKTLG